MSKYICKKCQNSSTCQLYQVSQHDSLSPIKSCYQFKKRKPTNADRIRVMSDEKLTKFLSGNCPSIFGGYRMHSDECDGFDSCQDCWLNWLKQEASDA